jgi:serine/threonine protein kinase
MKKVKGTKGFSQLVDSGISDSFCDGTYFFVMEKLGTSLMEIFENLDEKLVKTDVLKIGIELFKLVEKLHSFDIVHQDIKFDNILFTKKVPKHKIAHCYINHHSEKTEDCKRLAHHMVDFQQINY